MADSAGSYQSHVKCQFCEESEETKWICFNCNLELCGICNKRIHSKIEVNQNHKVIALKDINSEEAIDMRRRVDLENLPCEVHKDQKCVSFCLDCHVKLCLPCHDEHKDHNKIEMLKLFGENFTEILKVKQDIGKHLSLVEIDETNLIKISEDKSREYENVKDDINKREAEIIAEVKKYSQKLHDEVGQVYQPILNEIQNKQIGVQQMKVQLKEKRDIVDNILHSHQAQDVLDSGKTIGGIPVPQKYEDIPTTRCLFTQGDSFDSKVRQIFGEVYKVPELKLVKTYQTEQSGIRNIIDWNNNKKIISGWCSNNVQKVKFENDAMTVIKEKDIEVYDMAMMELDYVLISCEESELKLNYSPLEIITLITQYPCFDPLITLGVHLNQHNEVLVGLMEQPFIDTEIYNPDRKVVLLNQYGDIKHTYQYTRDKERLFTQPYRITTCEDTICVIDILDDSWEGRVVALDYKGDVQWIYNGEGNENSQKFYPGGMAVTPKDLFLVTDSDNHAIHVLNPRGQVLVCHQVKDLGVEDPLSICMDTRGLLWVGCFENEETCSKIHKMTLIH